MARARHAVYLDLNRDSGRADAPFGDGHAADQQLAGRPGTSMNGSLMARLSLVAFGTPKARIDDWMASFYARCACCSRIYRASASARRPASSPAAARARRTYVVLQYTGTGPVQAAGEVVVFPETGAKGVPLRLVEDRPSLLPGDVYHRDGLGRAVAGYPLTATFWHAKTVAGAVAKLQVREGAGWEDVPAHVFTPEKPASPEPWFVNLPSVCVVAKEPLLPRRPTASR